jgi:hypothetical protein
MLASLGLRLRQDYQFLTLTFFEKKESFVKKNNGDDLPCHIIGFLKMFIVETSFREFSTS